jgi:hypothetical protein
MIACHCQIWFWSQKPAWNVLQTAKLKTAGFFSENSPLNSVSPKPAMLVLVLNPRRPFRTFVNFMALY